MNKNKGFTLIELLVVIAIIGILSSVVLASLSNARDKGRDAAVQSQLASMKAQAELYYSKNETYYSSDSDNICVATQENNGFGGTTGPGLLKATLDSAGSAGTIEINTTSSSSAATTVVRCNVSSTAADDRWAVAAPLSTDGEYYCADNSGLSKKISGNLVSGEYECPTE